jgi:hypothetical protein
MAMIDQRVIKLLRGTEEAQQKERTAVHYNSEFGIPQSAASTGTLK